MINSITLFLLVIFYFHKLPVIIKKQDLLLAQFASLLDNDSHGQHDNEGESLDNVFDYDDDDKSYILK